jgi:hypothetical protein
MARPKGSPAGSSKDAGDVGGFTGAVVRWPRQPNSAAVEGKGARRCATRTETAQTPRGPAPPLAWQATVRTMRRLDGLESHARSSRSAPGAGGSAPSTATGSHERLSAPHAGGGRSRMASAPTVPRRSCWIRTPTPSLPARARTPARRPAPRAGRLRERRAASAAHALELGPEERAADATEQACALDGLRHVVVGPEVQSLCLRGMRVDDRHQKHGDPARREIAAYFLQKLDTVHIGEMHVGQDEIGSSPQRLGQALLGRTHGGDLVILRLERLAQGLAERGVVVHDQDP